MYGSLTLLRGAHKFLVPQLKSLPKLLELWGLLVQYYPLLF